MNSNRKKRTRRRDALILSAHARERGFERYGILFSTRKWTEFSRLVGNERHSIRLGEGRIACYFQRQWFLLVLSGRTVLTFLPLEDATDQDRARLAASDTYRRINDDRFKVLRSSGISVKPKGGYELPDRNDAVPIPEAEELPEQTIREAEQLLKRECDR